MTTPRVTDSRIIGVSIDDATHELSLDDAQRLYDALGSLVGIRRHVNGNTYVYPYPVQPRPYWPGLIYGSVTTAPPVRQIAVSGGMANGGMTGRTVTPGG